MGGDILGHMYHRRAELFEKSRLNPSYSDENDPMHDTLKFMQENTCCGAVSGCASSVNNTKPLRDFLPAWLLSHNVTSIVEASARHWPSGWQQAVDWPASLSYVGVDIIPFLLAENERFVSQGVGKMKSSQFRFIELNMLSTALPPADLLLTKDTLIHWPNKDVQAFLDLNVWVCPRRFRYVWFVHTAEVPAWQDRPANFDIQLGDRNKRNMREAPFHLQVEDILRWKIRETDKQGEYFNDHAVQLLTVPECSDQGTHVSK